MNWTVDMIGDDKITVAIFPSHLRVKFLTCFPLVHHNVL
jgi:hypothetical protein